MSSADVLTPVVFLSSGCLAVVCAVMTMKWVKDTREHADIDKFDAQNEAMSKDIRGKTQAQALSIAQAAYPTASITFSKNLDAEEDRPKALIIEIDDRGYSTGGFTMGDDLTPSGRGSIQWYK